MLHLERVEPFLGSTFIERLTGKRFAVLKIGNEHFTRHQLVTEVGTGNFLAARNLSKLVSELGLTTVRDLYRISPYELAGTHGIGTATLYVLMSIFEKKGLDVHKWMGGKATKTFTTLKHNATKKDAAAAKGEKQAIARAESRRGNARTKDYLKKKKKPAPTPHEAVDQLLAPPA